MSLRGALIRSALAGAATGGRTFTGLAALGVTADANSRQPERTLARPPVRGLVALLAVGELAADKIPGAPSRLDPRGVVGRVGSAVLCGVVIARADGSVAPAATPTPGQRKRETLATAACVATSLLAAGGAAVCGVRWRSAAKPGTRAAALRAVAEDAVAIGLATAATRRSW